MPSGLIPFAGSLLATQTGELAGAVGRDGKEYLFGILANFPAASAPLPAVVASGVAITGGTINGTQIGNTTRASVAASSVSITATDSSGTPGNVTNNAANGRAAFAAGASSVVVTSTAVAAADNVHVTLLGAADATLTSIVGVTVAAGSFTVTGNAAATANKSFMFTVMKV
jgi:hypothetical protein